MIRCLQKGEKAVPKKGKGEGLRNKCGLIIIYVFNISLFPYTAAPIALAFNETELPGAERDRELGTLYVDGFGSMVTVPVIVEADPCPSVQWSFKGSNIANGDNYTITNPCVANAESPFTFMLTVTNLTSETSGAYSAIFNNLAGDGMLPDLYITLEGTIEMSSMF